MKPSCFVATINLSLTSKLEDELKKRGFSFTKPPYSHFQARKEKVTLTLYESGKLTVQGKGKDELIEFYLEPEILGHFGFSEKEAYLDTTARIGIDEAGKGDFFGPLCIGGVYGGPDEIQTLHKLGVKDSKTMNDKKIRMLAKEIQKTCACTLIALYPSKYNQLYHNFQNLNSLLGWGHASAIENLVKKQGCQKVIIDQFAAEHVLINALKKKGVSVDLTQRHRGEEDLIVAAASIIARNAFLNGIDTLSHELSFQLPKGANAHVIEAGRKLVSIHGEEALSRYGKIHFKTTREILRA
ncbi:MAG: ribonuclease HIII [Simkaniaceae bacterium]